MTVIARYFSRVLLGLSLLAALGGAHAQLAIEITGAGAHRLPIVIADFAGEPGYSRALTSVSRADLERSGLFRLVEPGPTPISENDNVDFGAWKNKGADAFVGGSLVADAGGKFEARFRLYDVSKQASLGGVAFVTTPNMLRAAGHRIADYIYEKLIG
mgnify:FL=1